MTKRDYKLFFSLILWNILPSVYQMLRMNVISVNSVDINILGQMEWFDLIDEVIVTTYAGRARGGVSVAAVCFPAGNLYRNVSDSVIYLK